jgi:pseudomonalisin
MRGRTLTLLLFVLCSSLIAQPQVSESANRVGDLLSIRPADRIVSPISNQQRIVLSGQRHPLARAEYFIGQAAPELYMGRMILVLRADPAQDAALEELIRAQQDPESPYYHRWLTPEQFGTRFGISQNDLRQVTAWLQSRGMRIEEVPASRRTVVFSGAARQVESAFQTRIHRYLVNGEMHYANATDPEIPRALAAVVGGVVSLHDFRSAPTHVIAPNYTAANGAHFLMPQDWATIYDVGPLYNQGLDGTGQSIAVLGRVNIALSDVRTFRTNAGLPANDPQVILNGLDPGFPWCDDELESAMDVEWAGAIAKNATVKFVTTKSTTSSDGINLSAQYAVNHNVAPIITLSYGLCEGSLGTAGNAFWNSTWAQAAAQGMSVLVSSGDGGAAGCDSPALKTATRGRAVNGLCSTPYTTCVGGTQFNDSYNPAQYWSQTNSSGQSSALGYIPESVWNESGWSGGLWAGGGGTSTIYSKPAWQAGAGVPADGKRDVPDVAMHASIQDAYVVQVQGGIFYASGTSAAAPSLASVMALVNEFAGAAQGNANPVFYALANQQLSTGGPAVFHDITSGNNSVPGVTGFNAGAGYDEATGLGSVDSGLLVNHWSDGRQSNFTLTPSISSLSVAPGGSASATITLVGQGGFNSPATLSASGAPTGVTARFSRPTITAALPVTVTLTAASSATARSASVVISGTGGGLARTATIAFTVAVPSFTLTLSTVSATVIRGSSVKLTFSTAAVNGFKSAIGMSVSGLPKGVTGTFAPASIAAPGGGSGVLTLKAASTAAAGSSTIIVTASGGGVTRTQTVSVKVQ